MKLVKQIPLTEGGTCSQCGDEFNSLNGAKALCEYTESNGDHTYRLTEPFTFCKECFNELEK